MDIVFFCSTSFPNARLISVMSILIILVWTSLSRIFLVFIKCKPLLCLVPVQGIISGSIQSTSNDKWIGRLPIKFIILSKLFSKLWLTSLQEIYSIFFFNWEITTIIYWVIRYVKNERAFTTKILSMWKSFREWEEKNSFAISIMFRKNQRIFPINLISKLLSNHFWLRCPKSFGFQSRGQFLVSPNFCYLFSIFYGCVAKCCKKDVNIYLFWAINKF